MREDFLVQQVFGVMKDFPFKGYEPRRWNWERG